VPSAQPERIISLPVGEQRVSSLFVRRSGSALASEPGPLPEPLSHPADGDWRRRLTYYTARHGQSVPPLRERSRRHPGALS
jgi:hypothetical protein